MPKDAPDFAIAFGPAKEPPGPSSACRRLAGLLGVPADKLDDFKHLFETVVREIDDEEDGEEEKGEPEGDEGGEEY